MQLVRGRIDFNNIFDRARYPNLPYEKFTLVDARSGRAIEVFPASADSARVFSALLGARSNAPTFVRVRGKVSGTDLPIQESCTRDIKLDVESRGDITIEQ